MGKAGTWRKRSGEGGSFTSRRRILRLHDDARDQSDVVRQSSPTHVLVQAPVPQRNSHFPPAHVLVQVAPVGHSTMHPPPPQSNSHVAPTSQRDVHLPPVHEDEQVEPTSHFVKHPPAVHEKSQPDCPRGQVSVGVAVDPPSVRGAVEVVLADVDPDGDVPPSALPTAQS